MTSTRTRTGLRVDVDPDFRAPTPADVKGPVVEP
jgi:hypothetical protein